MCQNHSRLPGSSNLPGNGCARIRFIPENRYPKAVYGFQGWASRLGEGPSLREGILTEGMNASKKKPSVGRAFVASWVCGRPLHEQNALTQAIYFIG